MTTGDATIGAHSMYKGLAIGGTLYDGTPNESGTVDSTQSYVNALDQSANFNFNGGISKGSSSVADAMYDRFVYLAQNAKDSQSGNYKVVVQTMGGTYNMYDFNPGGQGEDNGKTLVIFNTDEDITLTKTSDGRQFGPTVIAPFAKVIVRGDAGFVDGSIYAKTFETNGNNQGSLQLHGDTYSGAIECGNTESSSTTADSTTAPPTESAVTGSYCNYNGCNGEAQGGEWCNANEGQCTGACNGQWCQPATVSAPLPEPTPSICLPTLDFEYNGVGQKTSAGDRAANLWANLGIAVSTSNSNKPAMLFDTANPTGGDTDLANDVEGMVLIISEDNDSSDPDDNAGGGTITIEFTDPVKMYSFGLLDLEESRPGYLTMCDSTGAVIGGSGVEMPTMGDGETKRMTVDVEDVTKIEEHVLLGLCDYFGVTFDQLLFVEDSDEAVAKDDTEA